MMIAAYKGLRVMPKTPVVISFCELHMRSMLKIEIKHNIVPSAARTAPTAIANLRCGIGNGADIPVRAIKMLTPTDETMPTNIKTGPMPMKSDNLIFFILG